jgi:hypothetical protein
MGWVQRAVYGVCLVLLGRECFEATIWQAELRGLVVMHTIRLYELAFKLEVITTTHEQLFTSMVGFVLGLVKALSTNSTNSCIHRWFTRSCYLKMALDEECTTSPL